MSVQGSIDQIITTLSAWRTARRIALLPHQRADADSLASVIALQSLLKRLGHDCDILTDEQVPSHISFLCEPGHVEIYATDRIYDCLIWVDHHQPDRLGKRERLWRLNQQADLLIIDHHQLAETITPAKSLWIDPTCSSASEMVARIILAWPTEMLDSQIAETLLAGIYADTGGLRFSNATCDAFVTCARLCAYDLSVERVCRRLFAELPLRRIRLRGFVFEQAKVNARGNLIWCVVRQNDLDRLGASQSDLEGINSMLREIAGIDLAILIQVMPDGNMRVSLRSSDRFNSAEFAKLYAGGGHIRAAGFNFPLAEPLGDKQIDSQINELISFAEQALNATVNEK